MASSKASDPHFILFPFMAQGHMIPLVDTARMLAQHGVKITIITTPLNAARFKTVLDREKEAGHSLHIIELPFPCQEVGLPEGCEHLEMIRDTHQIYNFFLATNMFREPVEKLFSELLPRPSCIISDSCLPYTIHIATKFNVPRITFYSMSCFCQISSFKSRDLNILDSLTSEAEHFVIPGFPDPVEFTTKDILYGTVSPGSFFDEVVETDLASYGVLMNSFEELEPKYVEEYKKARAGKVWCVGPVSLYCNKGLDKAERGNKAAASEHECLKWLDSKEPASVLYVCLGTLCQYQTAELIELGLALEASNRPFIWVISKVSNFQDLDKWMIEDGYEERVKERSLLIRGWAPQVVILSHPAVGGFLSHGGWNSTLESLSYGVPLILWPRFGDQFCNEKLVAVILNAGVGIEANENMVKKEDIKRAIDNLFIEGEEGEIRREQAKELQRLAKRAIEKEGSSYLNLTLFIQDIVQQTFHG